LRADRQHAHGVRRTHQVGNRQVGEGHSRRQHQGAMTICNCMRLRCGRAGVLVLAIVVATAHAAAADGLRAGQWITVHATEIDGVAVPMQQGTRCLTPEAVADLAKTFSPISRTTNSTCERVEHELTPQRLKWRLQCSGQIDLDVAGEVYSRRNLKYT